MDARDYLIYKTASNNKIPNDSSGGDNLYFKRKKKKKED